MLAVAAGKQRGIVAIVDDDGAVRSALLGLMQAAGHPARAFTSAREFLDSDAHGAVACLVLDVRMPGLSGLELQAELNARSAGLPVIFITAHDDDDARRRALKAGAAAFFQKPFDGEVLLASIRAVTGG